MKEPRDWDEDYILTGLPIGEFSWFEAKGSKVIKPDTKYVDRDLLSKAISAFANYGGGTLVLGIKQAGKNWQVDEGGIVAQVNRTSTKEWLEDIIPHLVELPLQTFNVYEAKRRLADSQIDSDKAIFVIEIGDSSAAPHQAMDNLYYGRVAGKTKPLNHRFVLDIIGRQRYPIIQPDFYYTREKNTDNFALNICLRNIGRIYASYVVAFISIPYTLASSPDQQVDFDSYTVGDQEKYAVFRKLNMKRDSVQPGIDLPDFGPARYVPILPDLDFHTRINLSQEFSKYRNRLFGAEIKWRVFADNAPEREGSIIANQITYLDVKQNTPNMNM